MPDSPHTGRAAYKRATVAAMLALATTAHAAARVRIIDGDTFAIAGEHIRILNIDAPERGKHARCKAEWIRAEQASDALEAEIVGVADLRIERHGLDRYGRTLARVYVGGRDVGEDLIAAGLAQPWTGHHARWC